MRPQRGPHHHPVVRRDPLAPWTHTSEGTPWRKPSGEAFIKHEFDEAIAIEEAIVEGERQLATSHPVPEVKCTLKGMLKDDQP